MSNVIASSVMVNGIRNDFEETYTAIQNRQSSSNLSMVMDLSVPATNKQHDFGYFESAPHIPFWQRGDPIPTDVFDSVNFNVRAYTWGQRIKWHREDRQDDQLQMLMEVARRTAQSAGLLDEKFFFDLVNNSAATLPGVPNAPDGVAMFNATNGVGGARFGVTGGNTIAGGGITTQAAITTDFYNVIERFAGFQDTKGEPLFTNGEIDRGFLIAYPIDLNEVMQLAFIQQRQIAGTAAAGASALGSGTNLTIDASLDITLWPTPRITTGSNDWYVFLKNSPKKPTFILERQPIQEETALEGENNSDHVRTTGEEYIQWYLRKGAGIALPYGAMQITNA